MRRIRGFHVTEEEKAHLERYLRVLRECPEEKKQAAAHTVDTYYENLKKKGA